MVTTLVPRLNDVLFGKGTSINTHRGNVTLRDMLEYHKPQFAKLKRYSKRDYAVSIVREVLNSGARFLIEDPNATPAEPNGAKADGDVNNNNGEEFDSPYTTDRHLLEKAWVLSDEEKVINKVMHRLRENKDPSECNRKQPPELEKGGESKADAKKARKSKDGEKKKKPPKVDDGGSKKKMAKAPQPGKASTRKTPPDSTDTVADRDQTAPLSSLATSTHAETVGSSFPRLSHHDAASIGPSFPQASNDVSETAGLAQAMLPSPGLPIKIPHWINSWSILSLSDYLKDAVDLSCLLTTELLRLVAAAEVALPDIVAENVTIFVELPSASNGNLAAIRGVRLQRSGTLPPMEDRMQRGSLPLSSRAVCIALGNILLEIFSKGQSSLVLSAQRAMTSVSMSAPTSGLAPAVANSLLLQGGIPMAVRQLVCDMVDSGNVLTPELSLEEIIWELNLMKNVPQQFLFDRTCPQQALNDTRLFRAVSDRHLFGREKELGVLTNAKMAIANHVRRSGGVSEQHNDDDFSSLRDVDFACKAIFLSGYAGSGKSCLIQSLIEDCRAEGWFILSSKFENQEANGMATRTKAFDDFFGYWAPNSSSRSNQDPSMLESFDEMCRLLASTVGNEGLSQLCQCLPNLGKIYPDIATTTSSQDHNVSIDKVGSVKMRHRSLFKALAKSIASVGRPVLLVFDDLQWCDSLAGLREFLRGYHDVPCVRSAKTEHIRHHGLMLVGSFRSNEIENNRSIIEDIDEIERIPIEVTKLSTRELDESDIGKCLSAKLCLPLRYTRDLASVVYFKTRGNPFFVIQLLKTIIQNSMLQFSIPARRWTWDCDVIEMLTISDGVAELLTTRYRQLPVPLMQTVMVASCFGRQSHEPMIDLLNAGQLLPFNMKDALLLAMNEGIIEKAGPIYQFTHDLIHQTIYQSIPKDERSRIHKDIGSILLGFAGNSATIYLLAVDQTNLYCKGSAPTKHERSLIASINAQAAKFSISAFNFERARSYVTVGLQMLDDNHWEEQYSLSLQLHEMSASISCTQGDTDSMASCLHKVIANVKSFEDSLTSSSLLAKMLAASSKYAEATDNCLAILSALGEEFPKDINLPTALSELTVIRSTLSNIDVDMVLGLPRMTDKNKLHAMKFLSMMCAYGVQQASYMTLPLYCCRMVRIMIEHGFCDDCIVGLVTTGFCLFCLTDDTELAHRIGKVAKFLVEESPNRDALKSRLCLELYGTLIGMFEKVTSIKFAENYRSAMLVGEVDCAVTILLYQTQALFHTAEVDLKKVKRLYIDCIKQAIKYQQNHVNWMAMSSFGVVLFLMGESTDEVEVKSIAELKQIAPRQPLLQYHNSVNEICQHFFAGDFAKAVEVSKKNKPAPIRRPLERIRLIYSGISALTLARQTGDPDARKMGEEAVKMMLKWEEVSKWSNECLARLLEAQLHYLNEDVESADMAYKASIATSRGRFLQYEATSCEMYGIFLNETGDKSEGRKQLQLALDKYSEWGARIKVDELQNILKD